MRQLHDLLRPAADAVADLANSRPGHPILERFADPIIPAIEPPVAKSPAKRMFDAIMHELEAVKSEKQDQRHTVFLIVYLPDRTRVLVDRMSTDNGQIIKFEGTDADTKVSRTAKVGALGFQYDFIVVEHPPHLYPVE
jgi:hypothetical protein